MSAFEILFPIHMAIAGIVLAVALLFEWRCGSISIRSFFGGAIIALSWEIWLIVIPLVLILERLRKSDA